MKPLLSPRQGRIIRTIIDVLARGNAALAGTVESATVTDWSSMTFTGERHTLTLRLSHRVDTDLAAATLIVPGAIIAVEHAVWSDDGTCVTVTLLALADLG